MSDPSLHSQVLDSFHSFVLSFLSSPPSYIKRVRRSRSRGQGELDQRKIRETTSLFLCRQDASRRTIARQFSLALGLPHLEGRNVIYSDLAASDSSSSTSFGKPIRHAEISYVGTDESEWVSRCFQLLFMTRRPRLEGDFVSRAPGQDPGGGIFVEGTRLTAWVMYS